MDPYHHYGDCSEALAMLEREYGHSGARSSQGQRNRIPQSDRVTEFLVDELFQARNRGPSPAESRDTIWRNI
ncbi:hypothetical protein Droror1_Dr00017777, partial [Drosera rotundifolia]